MNGVSVARIDGEVVPAQAAVVTSRYERLGSIT
jgi:hypothetical protein